MNVPLDPVRTTPFVEMESTATLVFVIHLTQVIDTFMRTIIITPERQSSKEVYLKVYYIYYVKFCVKIGKHCEMEQDPCAFQPCERGGVCLPSMDYTSYTCRCAPGWQGQCVRYLTCEPFRFIDGFCSRNLLFHKRCTLQ